MEPTELALEVDAPSAAPAAVPAAVPAAAPALVVPPAREWKPSPAVPTPNAPHAKSLFVPNLFALYCLALEVFCIILFGTCTTFEPGVVDVATPASAAAAGQLGVEYAMYQDVHIMMLLGFGFLYTLLRRYAWSGVSLNFLIVVVVIQLSILSGGFWSNAVAGVWPAVPLSIGALVNADFVAATVLISFGAVLGRVSATQLLVMAVFETLFATANVGIGLAMKISDPGGSIYIHTFGAAFGLALAFVIGDAALRMSGGEDKLGTSRHNGTFAMVGTLFLFCFWPSFNAATLVGSAQQRAVVNTVLAICASAVSSFALSRSIYGGTRFDMEHVQNATLAGGVALGAACDMMAPWGALLTGCVAGAVSTYGFAFLSPRLKSLGLTDTCGILNLHLLPGLIGGTASAIAAAGVIAPPWTTLSINVEFPGRLAGSGAPVVAGTQFAMTLISLLFGAVAGALTALIIRSPFAEPMATSFYEDAGAWNVPFDEEESPEGDTDIAKELDMRLAAVREETLGFVIARLKEAGLPGLSALALPRAPAQMPPAPATPLLRSANERFFEGSVRGGRAFAASKGERSVHGGSRYVSEEGVSPRAAPASHEA